MTWAELKTELESQGLTDDDVIESVIIKHADRIEPNQVTVYRDHPEYPNGAAIHY